MTLDDPVIQEALAHSKPIKRLSWGKCEFSKHIKHAHIPSRDPNQFKIEDDNITDWVVCGDEKEI